MATSCTELRRTDDVPELVPARMLNEFCYCPRLAYLEWVQGEFADAVLGIGAWIRPIGARCPSRARTATKGPRGPAFFR